MDVKGAYRPVDPDAYGGWPWPGARRVVRAAVLGAAAVVVVVDRPDAVGLTVAGGVVLLALAGLLVPYVVRRASPFVVDAPGIHVGGGDTGIEPRLLYWETVAEVVLLRRSGRPGRRHHAAGVRLRSAPGELAVRVALVDRRLDRGRLERAVARFATHDVAVVAGVADDDERSSVAAPPPGASEPDPAPAVAVDRSGVYSPVHPEAYVVRATFRHPRFMLGSLAFGVASLVVIAALGHPVFAVVWSAFFWLFPLLELRSVQRGDVHVAVDRPGVYLGRMTAPTEEPFPRLVPWAEVSSIVLFDVRFPREADPRRGVGVTSTGPDGAARLVAFRLTGVWDLDEARLRDAVRRFAPAVPVVDDPPRSVTDLIATSGGPPPASPAA